MFVFGSESEGTKYTEYTAWTFSTSTLWSPPSRAKTLGIQAQWRWYGRCGGGSVHRRRPGRRTVSLLTSPERLLLYWSWGGWSQLSSCLCARSCSRLCCSLGPRSNHFCPASCRRPLPSCTSSCRTLQWKSSHSIPSPSSSAQSVPPCTALVSRNQTVLGDQDTAARSNVLLSCFLQRERGFCVLCLGPGSGFWYLAKKIKNLSQYYVFRTVLTSEGNSPKCWLLTFLGTWQNPGFPTLFYTTKKEEKATIFRPILLFTPVTWNEIKRDNVAEWMKTNQ